MVRICSLLMLGVLHSACGGGSTSETHATGGTVTIGTNGSGGSTVLGGASSSGVTTTASGNTSISGSAGGTTSTSSIASTGSTVGTDCSGNLEEIQASSGLCVAKMVAIPGPSSDAGGPNYKIDATEVSRGQYALWLATNPALPASTDTNCGRNTSYTEIRLEWLHRSCVKTTVSSMLRVPTHSEQTELSISSHSRGR